MSGWVYWGLVSAVVFGTYGWGAAIVGAFTKPIIASRIGQAVAAVLLTWHVWAVWQVIP